MRYQTTGLEPRIGTLLARKRKLDRYADAIVDSPAWEQGVIPPEGWRRAIKLKRRIYAELGRLCACSLTEVQQ